MTLSLVKKVLIAEDHEELRKDIQRLLLKESNFVEVGAAASVQESLRLVQKEKPDLMLLDVVLSDGTAFDLLDKIPSFAFKIIFLTADRNYALTAIKYGALDYLLKPLNEREFTQALAKAFDKIEQAEQFNLAQKQYRAGAERIVIPTQDSLEIIHHRDLMYCQSNAGYTTFFLRDGTKFLTAKYLKEFEDVLPESHNFLRPHQSFIVNLEFVARYHKKGYLVLRDGTEIPVSIRKRDYVVEMLKNSQFEL